MLTTHYGDTANVVVESSASVATMVFLKTTVMQTIPWLTLAIPLLVLDGILGVRAAKMRYEKKHNEEDKFTFAKLFRKSIGKVFEYISWCVLGAGLSVLAQKGWVAWAVLALPFLSEGVSIVGHKLELQGVDVNITNFWRFIFRWGASKVGMEATKEDAAEIIKPKRDAKGRFVKKEDK